MRERLLALRVQIRHEDFVGRIEVLGVQERGEDTYLGADRRPMCWAFRHQLEVCFLAFCLLSAVGASYAAWLSVPCPVASSLVEDVARMGYLTLSRAPGPRRAPFALFRVGSVVSTRASEAR